MPWKLIATEPRCEYSVACPVDDWDMLFEEALRQLEHESDLGYVRMPRRIPGAGPVDAEALELMRKVLADFSGLEIRAL